MGRGLQEAADMVEKEMVKYQELLECAVMRRDFPDRPQTEMISLGTQFLREQTKPAERDKN